jgi:WD40 repeat protein
MAMEMFGLFGEIEQNYPIQAVVFLPDGTGFYTAGEDGVVRLWGVP